MICLSKELQQQIEAEGERCYPNECCGILFGILEDNLQGKQHVKRVKQIMPVDNSYSDEEQFHRFMITPETMLQAELEARRTGLEVIGFYHSHPNCPAFPSDYDTTHALPIYSYIITSVVFEIAVKTNSFELCGEDHTFYEEKIDITYID